MFTPQVVASPTTSSPELLWLHERAGYHQALELAADMIVANAETIAGLEARCTRADARCARYASDQASLILHSQRAERTA